MNDPLNVLKAKLLTFHPAYFQTDDYLLQWMTAPIASYLLQHGRLLEPTKIVFGAGVHRHCLESCGRNALMMPGANPHFGMALSRSFSKPVDLVWWVHSVCTLPDGTLIDSEPAPPLPTPPLYFMTDWCFDLWNLVPKKSEPVIPREQLPWFFSRSLAEVSRLPEQGEHRSCVTHTQQVLVTH